MKYFTIIFIFISLRAGSQQPAPTAFEFQRQKVNALLAERSAKFGQYDASLSARTGIFGLQTKNDIRNSNEILRQIALNDNNIFKELKILLDYKDLQEQQLRDDANSYSSRLLLYRQTIKKLQDQNQHLKEENTEVLSKNQTKNYFISVALLSILGMGYIFYRKFRVKVS